VLNVINGFVLLNSSYSDRKLEIVGRVNTDPHKNRWVD
jgi:hypothetical protein